MGTKVKIAMVPGYAAILGRDVAVHAIEHERAEQALEIAQANAPITTGHYEESLEVEDNVLRSTDPMAHLVEWGSVNNRAYATLREAAGEVARLVED